MECSVCNRHYSAGVPQNLCACGGAMLVRYDLDAVRPGWRRDALSGAEATMWRYAPVLPVRNAANVVSLGEGWPPYSRHNGSARAISA